MLDRLLHFTHDFFWRVTELRNTSTVESDGIRQHQAIVAGALSEWNALLQPQQQFIRP